ncbi:unnamed protein product [Caenorhabditis auriculariae]|uniref:Uncharacterized protein n=1 Tax=Caenorhabditis auriculariae TaxID=2777116 RepID=A0A8S1GW95_9PELO|nr:unnamed protein product [Caenorhabditis auriculariae]
MADNAAAVPAAEGANANGGWFGTIKSMLSRILFIYFISSMMKGFSGPQAPANSTSAPHVKGNPAPNLFRPGQLFDLYIFLDDSSDRFSNFNVLPLWVHEGIEYGNWNDGPNQDGSYVFSRKFPTPPALLRNQSVFLHTFIVKSGQSPNPTDKNYVKREVVYGVRQLNKYKKKYYKKTSNLLTGLSEQSKEDLEKAEVMKYEVLNFWHPNISVSLVDDQTNWQPGSLPAPLSADVKFSPVGDFYLPILFFNTYWNLGSEYMPVNETVKELNLTVTYQPLSLFKYQLYSSQQVKSQWSSVLAVDQDDDDQDSVKQALLETNPILLGVTVVVSILHTVLEFLAFKNDIQFWRSRKDLVGLSVRSVLFNIFQSLIVFLYICDNDTNFVVKVSVGIGLLIECWKIPKVLDVQVDWANPILGVLPRVKFSDKGSYVESDTKVYDQMAFKYLSWVLFPLLVGYAIYSILYVEQKGWYSWVLNMLYGYLLMFGFITMTPQLFINYKLKSVAHLPWRMLTYKFVNTFIDDLFAFVIRMPIMYRIGCFRDDIIFLIYLYQRYIYRVDPTRMNEFGTSLENATGEQPAIEEETKKEK